MGPWLGLSYFSKNAPRFAWRRRCWLGSAGFLKKKFFAGGAVGLARLAYFKRKSPRIRGPLARLGLSLVVHHLFFSAPGVAFEFSEKPCECEVKASMRVFDSHILT